MGVSLKLNIPEDFRIHWDRDRFCDSLNRIAADINRNLKEGNCGLAGKYEAELADMLKDAFLKAEDMPMHEIITDPRGWVLNWLEDRFQVTRQCLENSTCLANCTMFDSVDEMLMECDAETDFDCFIPDGTFSDCKTVDELVAALEKAIGFNGASKTT